MISVKKVENKADLKAFIDFPHDLYKTNPNYVPELFIAQRDLLTKHPFHQHSSIQLFLAYENDELRGRIAAIINNNHNAFNESNDGFFGFYDSDNSYEVSYSLFNAARTWLAEKGVKTMIGPVNFSTNETCGVLMNAYDEPPVVMMPYNEHYYPSLFEKYGLSKKVDLIAYRIDDNSVQEKSVKLYELLSARLARQGIVIRPAKMKEFKKEVAKIKEVYNSAWDKNLGFVPMTDGEFDYLANDLKLILDPDFCQVAELNGEIIGFSLAIPDINQALIRIKRGRLLPLGLLKLLYYKRKVNRIRVIALGILEPYRKMGIEACFYAKIITEGYRKGIKSAEASWVLENNDLMNRAIVNINGQPYKTYRIYEMAI